MAEAETSRSAWYPRMQVLVEFVLHGPSSAFPCVTNEYAPYKQQVLLAVLRLYATDPGCVTWRRQRPETAWSARHTRIRRAHTAHPQTFTPTGATGLHHARHVPLPLLSGYPWLSRPAVIHDCARLEPSPQSGAHSATSPLRKGGSALCGGATLNAHVEPAGTW